MMPRRPREGGPAKNGQDKVAVGERRYVERPGVAIENREISSCLAIPYGKLLVEAAEPAQDGEVAPFAGGGVGQPLVGGCVKLVPENAGAGSCARAGATSAVVPANAAVNAIQLTLDLRRELALLVMMLPFIP